MRSTAESFRIRSKHIGTSLDNNIIGHSPGSGSGLCYDYSFFVGKYRDALATAAPAAAPVFYYPPQKAIAVPLPIYFTHIPQRIA